MTRREFAMGGAALFSTSTILKGNNSTHSTGDELIGRPAPPLSLANWLNSKPLDMADLRGKVVLLRWWTDGCPFCEATAPSLIGLEKEYGARGFQVIGVYHPKPPGKWSMPKVRRAVEEKHFTFPIAVDGDWTALKRWWLTEDRNFTSVSFLVDQKGIIRYVHPGGEFHEGQQGGIQTHEACNRDMHFIQKEIARLINT